MNKYFHEVKVNNVNRFRPFDCEIVWRGVKNCTKFDLFQIEIQPLANFGTCFVYACLVLIATWNLYVHSSSICMTIQWVYFDIRIECSHCTYKFHINWILHGCHMYIIMWTSKCYHMKNMFGCIFLFKFYFILLMGFSLWSLSLFHLIP